MQNPHAPIGRGSWAIFRADGTHIRGANVRFLLGRGVQDAGGQLNSDGLQPSSWGPGGLIASS